MSGDGFRPSQLLRRESLLSLPGRALPNSSEEAEQMALNRVGVRRLPLCPNERTSPVRTIRSEKCQERKNHKGVLSPNDQSPFENRCRPGQPSASRRCYAIAHGPAALVSFSPRIRERHGRVAAERHALSFATNAS